MAVGAAAGRRAAALGAVAAVLLGCGGGEPPRRAGPDVERAVRAVFADYAAAMRAGDHERACGHLAPESIDRLRRNAAKLTRTPPRRCADLLALTTAGAGARERRQLAEVARTAAVDGVYAVEGRDDVVTIAWTATVDGRRVPIQQPARRIAGEWTLVGAGG